MLGKVQLLLDESDICRLCQLLNFLQNFKFEDQLEIVQFLKIKLKFYGQLFYYCAKIVNKFLPHILKLDKRSFTGSIPGWLTKYSFYDLMHILVLRLFFRLLFNHFVVIVYLQCFKF